jgi:single-strand DNA-binding protein
MNHISIHGRLTRNPEMKSFEGKNGTESLCNFSVAVDRSYGEETDFFNCSIFGKRAEVIHKFFSKGSEIALEGEMQMRTVTKDDEKRTYWGIRVSNFDFCGKKSDADSKPKSKPTESPKEKPIQADADGVVIEDKDDDDLPF